MNFRKKVFRIVTPLFLLCPAAPVGAQIEYERMRDAFAPLFAKAAALEVVTTIYDIGQRVNALRIDLGEGKTYKGREFLPDLFEVSAETRVPDGTVHYKGRRKVTAIYASPDGIPGHRVAEGRYILLELACPKKRNPDGSTDEEGSETYAKGKKLTLSYTVAFGKGDPKAQTGIRNLLADDFARAEVNIGPRKMGYRYFDPRSAYAAPPKGYPLVLFLHGEEERGTDNELPVITSKGASLWVELAARNPCYVLAPQVEGEWTDAANDALVMKLLDTFIAGHNVDPGRIYVHGYSMGGVGTWNMILAHPERFAAAMPMCGYAPERWYQNSGSAFDAVKNMPVWTFVVANDDPKTVEGTRKAVERLTVKGRERERTTGIKFEMWTANSCLPVHACWERVFYIGTPYHWMMTQSRERTRNLTVHGGMTYTSRKVTPEITSVTDYEMDQLFVIDKGDRAFLVDSAMGNGNLLDYLRESVLKNKDCDLYVFITHDNADHFLGMQWFRQSAQLKKVYLFPGEDAGTLRFIPREKIEYVQDGQKIPFGSDELTFFSVPGHTIRCGVMFYRDLFFPGDAIGSGDIFLNASLQEFRRSMRRFVSNMERYKKERDYKTITLYPGHLEYKDLHQDGYVHDMLACVEGAIDGSILTRPFTRRETTYATYNLSSISYNLAFAFGASDESVQALREAIHSADTAKPEEYTPISFNAFKTAYSRIMMGAKRDAVMRSAAMGSPRTYPDLPGVIKEKPARDLTEAIRESMAMLVKK